MELILEMTPSGSYEGEVEQRGEKRRYKEKSRVVLLNLGHELEPTQLVILLYLTCLVISTCHMIGLRDVHL